MKTIFHPSGGRGKGDYGWLSTRYSFSFADWHDSGRTGFGALRVLNDDRVAPASGFPMHGHHDMEIVTIVTAGEVTHKDDLGNDGKLKAGEVQVISAGTGLAHSEWNESKESQLRLYQIWLFTDKKGHAPRYEERSFGEPENGLALIASGRQGTGALFIHQGADIHKGAYDAGLEKTYYFRRAGRGAYFFVKEGKVKIGDCELAPRDAVGISEADFFELKTLEPSKFLLIDVPMHGKVF